jgi:hypothetical protein
MVEKLETRIFATALTGSNEAQKITRKAARIIDPDRTQRLLHCK